MSTHESQLAESLSLSRRHFLRLTACAAAGTALAPCSPLLVATGHELRAEEPQPGQAPTHVLRAVRFSGAPDGRKREIWGYDNQCPGPLIRAKEGDLLRIKVVNELGVPTTIHWHGMHQPGTWRMDGVAGVSQPPFPSGKDFLYEFRAVPAGTHWYHSHEGVQYGNGLFGPLIIDERTPIATYDREEILLMNDWFLQLGETIVGDLLKGTFMKMNMKAAQGKPAMKDMPDVGDVPFQSGLINGKGRAPGNTTSPLTVVAVTKGETLRLRLINGSSTYAFRFQIDGHPLTVISTDGAPIKPLTVDNLVINVGERYDVLLKAEQEEVHWIRAVTLDGNEVRAVLRYAGASQPAPLPSPVRWAHRFLKAEEMHAREPAALDDKPREFSLRLGGSMMPYRWNINDQYYPKAETITLQKDEPVRFVLKNPTRMDHPFHLHGHYFRVLGKPGNLNLTDPVQKDTVNVPANSEMVIQWRANNPGRWFFHCHIEWHLETGMARVIEIKPS